MIGWVLAIMSFCYQAFILDLVTGMDEVPMKLPAVVLGRACFSFGGLALSIVVFLWADFPFSVDNNGAGLLLLSENVLGAYIVRVQCSSSPVS